MFDRGKRHHADELLDDPETPRRDVERSLRDLERFNSLAGGSRVYREMIRRIGVDQPSILDIGTGTSDMLSSIDARLRCGLDLSYRHLDYGRHLGREGVARVTGSALELPFADRSFDLVTSSHFIHHFDQEDAVKVAREALRVTRRAVVFSDTRRSFWPWLFTVALGKLRLVGPVTRFDAPASVQRGFDREELAAIGAATGHEYTVNARFPFRLILTIYQRG